MYLIKSCCYCGTVFIWLWLKLKILWGMITELMLSVCWELRWGGRRYSSKLDNSLTAPIIYQCQFIFTSSVRTVESQLPTCSMIDPFNYQTRLETLPYQKTESSSNMVPQVRPFPGCHWINHSPLCSITSQIFPNIDCWWPGTVIWHLTLVQVLIMMDAHNNVSTLYCRLTFT